ncbi:MAG: hypothetical protein K0U29_04615 [Gammaproteobacteria bacterium]|nr:hypothetical protein [Gammaproteobacteria bacterium]MCH9744198.1 hypothetical protein [Gammaproteobacteria bacterium]
MKKILLFVFSGFLLFSVASFAGSGFGDSAPAQQSFHEADPTAASDASQAQQVAKTAAIMQQSAQTQHHVTAAKKAQQQHQKAQSESAQPVANAAANSVQGQAVQQVSQQLSSFIQTSLQFQQANNQKIAALSNQIEKLQVKQAALVQFATILEQGKPALAGNLKPIVPQASAWEKFESQYSMAIIIALLAVILLMLMFRKRVPSTVSANIAEDEVDTKDEYDYMGSSEAIPAKLDLAHAYIAMEDFTAARKVLRQVIISGDEKQQAEANKMIDNIAEK